MLSTASYLKDENGRLVFFGEDLTPFFPGGAPRTGNAAEDYARSFRQYHDATRRLSSAVLNDPAALEKLPEIFESVGLLERGAECLDCDFNALQPAAVSEYFYERPSTVGTMMLAKLLFRRTERALERRDFAEAQRLAGCGVIFAVHLYQTAETHAQATIGIHILAAGMSLAQTVQSRAGRAPEAQAAGQMQLHFRSLLDEHIQYAPAIHRGTANNLRAILEALVHPLPAVRIEGLRKLGNVIDPQVEAHFLTDPAYRPLRQQVHRQQQRIALLFEQLSRNDPDSRVRRLAADLKELLLNPPPPPDTETAAEDRASTSALQ